MKAILYKHTHRTDEVETIRIYLFGLCVYHHETHLKYDTTPRPVGFLQYEINAPTEVETDGYFPEEFKRR